MEHIRQAIERAAKGPSADIQPQQPASSIGQQPQSRPNEGVANNDEVVLSSARLESKRIISHDVKDPRSKSFGILRTEILQSMDMKSWRFLGITSPTEGCGKSILAINLALSIACQPHRSVLLVDMDLQKPQIADYLGLNCDRGIASILAGKTSLQSSLIRARLGEDQILVLPCEASLLNSSGWIASPSMAALLQIMKRDFKAWTVIFDLPPTLASDDVISFLPQLDCVLFVVAAGTTTAQEIRDCGKYLESTEVVRVVLNKTTAAYSQYTRYGKAARTSGP
jgi:Mrp family chromosome partitioning ATPase